MNKHLKQLIDLSEVDKEIDAFEPQIDEANYKYEATLATRDNLDGEISSIEDEIKNEELKKHKNELHLAELSAKLEDNKKKSSEIKTEREMKSLQLEEEIAKEQVAFANEEIVRLDKLVSAKKVKLEEMSTKKAEIDTNLATIKADVDIKLGNIEITRRDVFAKKEKLVGEMNQKGLAFYQKIRRWAKNTTAVELKDQACMGCFMHVNDKVFADVIKGEEIVTCPHCGRILYMAQGEEA
ncbi:MAG: zinc ribbon domain-containing protein [Thiovulaceae bacterium]|nr:zinc ribbon domain-containing protein [Sulfurimonadaceae bacterium]